MTAYKYCFKNDKLHANAWKVDGIKVIDNRAFDFRKEDEFIFEGESKLRGFANAFVIITRRVSIETGAVIYEIYNRSQLMCPDNV